MPSGRLTRRFLHVDSREYEAEKEGFTAIVNNYINLRRNIFPVNKSDSLCLIISSCFFLLPGAYGFYYDLHFYGVASAVTTVISVNYWRHAIEGIRRTIDLIIAKISFVIYFLSGCFFIRDAKLLMIGICGCVAIILSYYLSNRLWTQDSPHWVYFHMMFHLFVALEQFLVLYAGVHIT